MRRSAVSEPLKPDALRLRILPILQQPTKEEPPWRELVELVALPVSAASGLILSLQQLWRLPFANTRSMADLLIFRYAELENARRTQDWSSESEQLSKLFELMMDMALQGNSLFPQNPADIASQARDALEGSGKPSSSFTPLVALLLSRDGKLRTGLNFGRAKDLEEIVEYEHRRRSGSPEWCWRAPEKYALLESDLKKQAEFSADWKVIRDHFDVGQHQDPGGVIRRSPLVEGNWRKTNPSNLNEEASRFQVVFDFFCWKWFLYGMNGDEPMLQKLAVTLTPFGTQIFIPGFWSLDPARDINWAKVTRLHRARGISKQGEKLAHNREGHLILVRKIRDGNEAARRKGLRGSARYTFIKNAAGLSQETDDSEIRQYLRKSRSLK